MIHEIVKMTIENLVAGLPCEELLFVTLTIKDVEKETIINDNVPACQMQDWIMTRITSSAVRVIVSANGQTMSFS